MAVTQKRGGVEVDGLAQTLNALKKLDGAYLAEAKEILRDSAKDVQYQSQKLIGRVGRYPTQRGMIGRSATSTGAGVRLRSAKYPWALAAEFGEQVANVPRKGKDGGYSDEWPQDAFKRRTFGIWRPPTSSDMFQNKGGYMIQPTLRRMLPKISKDINLQLFELIDRAHRKAGVPRGR